MADQTTKKDILQIVKLSKKYDYSDKQVLKQILDLSEQRSMFQSKFGKKYLSRLRTMYEDLAYEDVCIICNKNETTAGVMCSSCMDSLVASLEKTEQAKIKARSEVLEEKPEEESPVEEVPEEEISEEEISEEEIQEEEIQEEEIPEEEIQEEEIQEPEVIYEEPVETYAEPAETYEEPVVPLPKSSKIHFCRNCGKMITSAMDRCLLCGTSRNDGYNYCGCCGSPVPMRPVAAEKTVETQVEKAPKEKKAKKSFFGFLMKDSELSNEIEPEYSTELFEEEIEEIEEIPEKESKRRKTSSLNKSNSEVVFGNVKRKHRFSLENIRMGFIVFFNNFTDSFKSLFSRTDRESSEYPENIIKLDFSDQKESKAKFFVIGALVIAAIIGGVVLFNRIGGYEKALGKTIAQVEKEYGTPKELMNINSFKTYEYPEGVKIHFQDGIAIRINLNKSTKKIFGVCIGEVTDEETLMKDMKTQGLDYKGSVNALDGHINYSFSNNRYNVRVFTLGGMIDDVEVLARE